MWSQGEGIVQCPGLIDARDHQGGLRTALRPLMTGNVFRAGHRIRLEVSSSNYPRFARNLNTAAGIRTRQPISSPPTRCNTARSARHTFDWQRCRDNETAGRRRGGKARRCVTSDFNGRRHGGRWDMIRNGMVQTVARSRGRGFAGPDADARARPARPDAGRRLARRGIRLHRVYQACRTDSRSRIRARRRRPGDGRHLAGQVAAAHLPGEPGRMWRATWLYYGTYKIDDIDQVIYEGGAVQTPRRRLPGRPDLHRHGQGSARAPADRPGHRDTHRHGHQLLHP